VRRADAQRHPAVVRLAGEEVLLLPERAIYWPRSATLLLADPHWGKAAAFRAAGVPVPETTTLAGLQRLEALVETHRPSRIVFLGDYLHAREGRVAGTLRMLREWGERHRAVEQVLVRGNHDRGAGDPPPELGVHCVSEPLRDSPFVLRHHPARDPEGFVMAGHLHPAVRLIGRGRQRERLPCFWIAAGTVVLPSFGEFTGTSDVHPAPEDTVFVVAGGSVIRVGS
jgi:uncharacterized protein